MRIERHDDHIVVIGGPVPPGAAAITLIRIVIVRDGRENDQRLMLHELVHVRQWSELGIIGFLHRYLREYFRWRRRGFGHWDAYRRIPLEVLAEREAQRAMAEREAQRAMAEREAQRQVATSERSR